jgi:Fur family ferric uptake transcriptional regulator
MANPHETLQSILKARHYSMTKARLAVFDQLVGSEPLSMNELVTKVTKVQGSDRASVYRTVALFEELGVITRVHIGWKYKLELSEAFADHHHHLSCLGCKQTIAMNEDLLERIIERLSAQHGFTPTAHQIEVQGYCKTCAPKYLTKAA